MAEKKVAIYSLPTCPNCKKTKEYLTEKGIPYVDYDVSPKNAENSKALFQKTKQMGVPVIFVDDEFIVGFNKSKLENMLSK